MDYRGLSWQHFYILPMFSKAIQLVESNTTASPEDRNISHIYINGLHFPLSIGVRVFALIILPQILILVVFGSMVWPLWQWVSNLKGVRTTWRAFLKRGLDPNCRVSDSARLGWDLRIWIYNKFLGDVDMGPGTKIWGAGCSERDITPWGRSLHGQYIFLLACNLAPLLFIHPCKFWPSSTWLPFKYLKITFLPTPTHHGHFQVDSHKKLSAKS